MAFNGANLADGGQFLGTASPVLSIGNAQTANAGGYSVVVANAIGSATSTLASLTVVVPGSCLPAAAGLVGWWPGDGNANDITGTNNGTLQGGATATAAGDGRPGFWFRRHQQLCPDPRLGDPPAQQPDDRGLGAFHFIGFSRLGRFAGR